jgi:hypothetical protein
VLSISTDFAFCLHSKERVPYHIIIEVAYEDQEETLTSSHEDANTSEDNIHGTGLANNLAAKKRKTIEYMA